MFTTLNPEVRLEVLKLAPNENQLCRELRDPLRSNRKKISVMSSPKDINQNMYSGSSLMAMFC